MVTKQTGMVDVLFSGALTPIDRLHPAMMPNVGNL